MTTKLTQIKDKKNLIVDTATQCNLLCKIIIDYMSNKKCHIKEGERKTRRQTRWGCISFLITVLKLQ